MDELVESVLSVSSRLSPHDRAGGVIDLGATTSYVFSIRLHVTLKGNRLMQSLVTIVSLSLEKSLCSQITQASGFGLSFSQHFVIRAGTQEKPSGLNFERTEGQTNHPIHQLTDRLTSQVSTN